MLPGIIPVQNQLHPITITGLGTSTASNGATSIAKVIGSNVPAGAVILVGMAIGGSPSISSVTDGTNSYSQAATASSVLWLYSSAVLTSQLNSGSTITINLTGSVVNEGWMGVGYATGLAASTADVTGSGSSSTSLSTSAAITKSNELAVVVRDKFGGGAFTDSAGFSLVAGSTAVGPDSMVAELSAKVISGTLGVITDTTTGAYNTAIIATFKGR